MKKDITIPVVKDVYIAIVKEWNKDFSSQDWIVYLINDSREALESVMVMSRGKHKDGRKTATFRHAFKVVAAKASMKVELIMEELFSFENEFILTYFQGGKLYDKVYKAMPNSVSESSMVSIPVMEQEGVLLK